MANYRRKRPRKQPKCTMCTSGRLVKGGESVGGRGGRANQPKFWPKVDDPERD